MPFAAKNLTNIKINFLFHPRQLVLIDGKMTIFAQKIIYHLA